MQQQCTDQAQLDNSAAPIEPSAQVPHPHASSGAGKQAGNGTWQGQTGGPSHKIALCAMQATAFCRVCLEEDSVERCCQPCSCSGSMSCAHPACIQQWINEKGDMRCEICKQPYTGDFRQPPPQPPPAATAPMPVFRGFLISTDSTPTTYARHGFHEVCPFLASF